MQSINTNNINKSTDINTQPTKAPDPKPDDTEGCKKQEFEDILGTVKNANVGKA